MDSSEINFQRRNLHNQLMDIEAEINNLTADLKKIERKKAEIEKNIRILKHDINRKELELEETKSEQKKLENQSFQIEEQKKLLKKKREKILADIRTLSNMSS